MRHKSAPVSNGCGGYHHVHVADRNAIFFESGADFGVVSRTILVPRHWRSKLKEERNGVQNAFGALFAGPEEKFAAVMEETRISDAWRWTWLRRRSSPPRIMKLHVSVSSMKEPVFM